MNETECKRLGVDYYYALHSGLADTLNVCCPKTRGKQVCVQLPTSADNVTLLVFAADRRPAVRRAAAAPLLRLSGPPTLRSISPACPAKQLIAL